MYGRRRDGDDQALSPTVIEGGCSGLLVDAAGLRSATRRFAHHIPFVVALDGFMTAEEAHEVGAVGVIGGRGTLGLLTLGEELRIDSEPGGTIDTIRARVAALGRVGLLRPIDDDDLRAVALHKRAGGIGILARYAPFRLSREDGVALLHGLQDVLRCGAVTVA